MFDELIGYLLISHSQLISFGTVLKVKVRFQAFAPPLSYFESLQPNAHRKFNDPSILGILSCITGHPPAQGFEPFLAYFFLASLLFGTIVAWLQTFRAIESEPRIIQSAQQFASLVNLSRAALRYSESIARVSLIKTLADEEHVRDTPREPKDRFELLTTRNLAGLSRLS